ncbi:type II toxin-antitoxin system ParD family antitoxin [Massilia sp. R2A-15]|uniref:type II toxin-antitoxin system ParD family antitoxin n=1 Tax=Massilia sp. R2A-15 TaxID=3064278 RepID=UPI002733B4B0|nr:type II toxin-antitoxin system ParD family antitoxin [Massilia sp. R2A-15]WLI89116.1 type II toxin-antitoxin system ParD family antitoxin [Massilia sp. R2A-15]
MTTIRKTITVTEQQDKYIKAQVEAGHYTNDSEYFRDLIRRDQYGDLAAIRAALSEGESSGEPRPFDLAAFKKRMKSTAQKTADRLAHG